MCVLWTAQGPASVEELPLTSTSHGPGADLGGCLSADSTPFVSVLPTPSQSPPPGGGHSTLANGHGAYGCCMITMSRSRHPAA